MPLEKPPKTMDINQIRHQLSQIMQEAGLNYQQVAENMGNSFNEAAVIDLLHGNRNLGLPGIKRFADACGYDVSIKFKKRDNFTVQANLTELSHFIQEMIEGYEIVEKYGDDNLTKQEIVFKDFLYEVHEVVLKQSQKVISYDFKLKYQVTQETDNGYEWILDVCDYIDNVETLAHFISKMGIKYEMEGKNLFIFAETRSDAIGIIITADQTALNEDKDE